MGELNNYMFNWKDPHVTNWKKCLRIVYTHGFVDIDPRGMSDNECARRLIQMHEKDLPEEELEFLRGLLK